MSIEQIQNIIYNRPECLYCKSICEITSGGEAMMSMTSYDCKSCGDYFSNISAANIRELQFTCKEFCIFYEIGSAIFQIYNTDSSTDDKRVSIPRFDIDFSDREKLYEKLKTYLVFA